MALVKTWELLPKSHGLSNKNPGAKYANPISNCWSEEPKSPRKTIEATSVALGCSPEVLGKSLFMKMPCTSDAELKKNKADLSGKLPP